MKLFVPPLELSENTGFSNEVDIFNRRQFGESLLELIQNTDEALVIALDAPWGEGKSTFTQMWMGLLNQREVPYIHFDSFENDYQTDPFLAISSQIYSLIDENDQSQHQEFKKKAIPALKIVGRAGLRIGLKAITAGILDETVLDDTGNVKDASKEVSDLADKYFSNQLSKANEHRECLLSFKSYLTDLASKIGNDNKVVFIIDELDRCKPKFALALLESVKHFFSVENIAFLLVMNREQLEESVRCEYGAGVDASKYLQKFVSIWASLPKLKNDHNSVALAYVRNCLMRMDYEARTETQQITITVLEELATYYDLSLRDIEKSLTNFAIVNNATDGNLNSEYSHISVFISVIKVIKPALYSKLARNAVSYNEVIEQANLGGLKVQTFRGDEDHYLIWLLKYYLGTENEANELLKNGHRMDRGYGGRDAISNICKWLEAFKRC